MLTGGRFEKIQAGFGGVAWFNMWSVELNLNELNALGCKDKGDVVSMDTLQITGTVSQWTESFPCHG